MMLSIKQKHHTFEVIIVNTLCLLFYCSKKPKLNQSNYLKRLIVYGDRTANSRQALPYRFSVS